MSNFVFAADWVQIDEKTYLDSSSVHQYQYSLDNRNDRIYSVWLKLLNDGTQIWKEIENDAGKKIWYSLDLDVLNELIKNQIFWQKWRFLYVVLHGFPSPHNPEVVGSSPSPATISTQTDFRFDSILKSVLLFSRETVIFLIKSSIAR